MKTIIALLFCFLLGGMVIAQGWIALVWFPLGFVISVFVTAQIALPIILGFPRAIRLVSRGEMRSAVYARLLIVPLLWVVMLFVIPFLIGFFWPSAATWLEDNVALNVGSWLGIIGILLSPLSKKSREDFRQDFDRSYGQFYTSVRASSDLPAMARSALNAFKAATDDYDAALNAIETYTTLANHRAAILDAKRAVAKASADEFADAAAAYDDVVAACKNPVDHEQYTAAELRAHTIAIDELGKAFDRVTTAFVVLDSASDLYPSAAALYKALRDSHAFATRAYAYAADCAMTASLEGQLQAAKDEWELMLLEERATNPAEPDPVAIKARAAAFKVKVAESATAAKMLQEQAKIAEAKAEVFLTQANSAQASAPPN